MNARCVLFVNHPASDFMTQFSRIFRSEPLLFVLWANELIRLIWSPPELQAASGWLMIVYVAM
ncbi:MAG: hypothetical protein ACKVH1_12035, partial [Alphaproteobacteria bacterium]